MAKSSSYSGTAAATNAPPPYLGHEKNRETKKKGKKITLSSAAWTPAVIVLEDYQTTTRPGSCLLGKVVGPDELGADGVVPDVLGELRQTPIEDWVAHRQPRLCCMHAHVKR